MEIGISTQQLFDIGLNIVGVLSAGALLMLIRSFFTGRKEKAVPVVTSEKSSIPEESEVTSAKRTVPEKDPIEYIDLKGINWNHKKDSVPIKPVESLDSPNRRRVIGLAKKMLANAHELRQRTSAETDQNVFAGKAEIIREGAGR
jgi:hypothetical protein